MLSDWVLPTTGQSLNSFMGLLAFYDRYVPYLEIQIKPLRQLLKAYFRKAIHPMAWSPTLIALFHDIEVFIIS